jgi:hypothetical protein
MKRLTKKASGVWISVKDHWEDPVNPKYVKPTHSTAEITGIIKFSAIENLPGANNENRDWYEENGKKYFGNYSEEGWNKFLEDIKQNGIKEPIYIQVLMDGQIVVYEGNHRIQAAKQLGLTEVPARIRFLGNSQDIVHIFDI